MPNLILRSQVYQNILLVWNGTLLKRFYWSYLILICSVAISQIYLFLGL